MIVSLSSSSFCTKQHENILDQGFLLGPSDSAIFPSTVPPILVSSTFDVEYPHQWQKYFNMTDLL